MPAQQPCIMESNNDGDGMAELGQFSEVEVSAVKVVAVKDMRFAFEKAEKVIGGWKIKILFALKAFKPSYWLPN